MRSICVYCGSNSGSRPLYTERAIARKARLDRFYVRKSRALLDLYIIWRTGVVMLTGFGAR